MTEPAAHALRVFLEVQRGLPRQGPGNEAATRKALSLCAGLPERPVVLDIGCGPGMQTLVLARTVGGEVTAVDVVEEYLDALRERAVRAGLRDRIRIERADMARLPYAEDSIDLLWSEGAAYIMGFERALSAWRRLLRPGGYLAVTELTWLVADPPREVADFFAAEYPAMTDVASNRASIREAGYEPIGHFTLPDAAWWDDYYTPLEAKLPTLRARYAGDDAALAVVAGSEREIEMRRRFRDAYGYVFFVARAPGSPEG